MKESFLIVLGGGKSQFPFIESGLKLGYKIILIDKNKKSIGVKKSDIFINESTHNVNSIIKKIKELDIKISGLIARTTGNALYTAAAINEHFKLIGVNKELVEISISKSKLRDFLNKAQISSPQGENVKSISSTNGHNLFSKYNAVVVKPEITVVGKKGIYLCKTAKEINDKIPITKMCSFNNHAEVQKYIDGKDSCLLVWFSSGKYEILLSWDEHNSFQKNSKKLVGNYISMPANKLTNKSKKFITKCCEKFSKRFCEISFLLAFSFRFDNKGEGYLIEVHADLTGDLILEKLAPKSTGENFFDKIIDLHVGKKISVDYKMKKELIEYPG